MIILLHPDAGPPERAQVLAALAALGVTAEELALGDRTALLVTGPTSLPAESLARVPGVARVLPLRGGPRRVFATAPPDGRTIRVGPAAFGGGQVSVIAGPCTVEDRGVLARIARLVKAAGATALRGGVFKVRTSPDSYQGGGHAALADLVAVSREVGLPFFTEFSDPRQIEAVGESVDAVQIGARHMQNFPLLTEAARLGKPILLKRHMAADVDEWLHAAEYVLAAGNDRVILCERGVKTADRHVRYMLDVGVVPYLKRRIGLPVIVDPSHAAGHHELVAPLARAALAAGADGLIIEVHPEPQTTHCDALQALPPAAFDALMGDVRALVDLDGRTLCEPPSAALPGPRPLHNRAVGA